MGSIPRLQLSPSLSSRLFTTAYRHRRSLHLRALALHNNRYIINKCSKFNLHCYSSSSSTVEYATQEGPSCIFVGPVETATKDMLEELYHQARDSYYSGHPLILDDMFDKVELKLRWYGSKLVVKYPRCSLKRQSTYADAEIDPSQAWALASVWISLLVVGIVALVVPPVCTLAFVCQDALRMQLASHSSPPMVKPLEVRYGVLATVLSSTIGYPITMAAVRALQGLWRNDLVALKGSCPGCGEEVFAFVRADESVRPRHKTECHVCQRCLVFHAKVEHSMSNPGSRWVHGRIYLVSRIKDLGPQGSVKGD